MPAHRLVVGCVLVLFVAGPAMPEAGGSGATVGWTGSVGAMVDGTAVPAGTTLVSPSDIHAGATAVWLWLGTGEPTQVGLAERSHVSVRAEPSGEVLVAVHSGTIALPHFAAAGGRSVAFGTGAVVELAARQEPIGEGERVDAKNEIDLCELCDAEVEGSCVKPPAEVIDSCAADWKDDACRWIPVEETDATIASDFLLLTAADGPFFGPLASRKERVGVLAYGNDFGVDCSCPAGLIGCVPFFTVAGVGGLAVVLPPVLEKRETISPTTP